MSDISSISLAEVDLREVPAAGHLGGEVHHVWQRVRVRDGDAVETAVIPAGPPLRMPKHCLGGGLLAGGEVWFGLFIRRLVVS